MVIPSKEEYVPANLIVQGSRLLRIVKDGAATLDDIQAKFPTPKNTSPPSIERLMDIVTFLYISNFIDVSGGYVSIRRVET